MVLAPALVPRSLGTIGGRLEFPPTSAAMKIPRVKLPFKSGLFAACLVSALLADRSVQAGQIKTVFVIALENHNWTQPNGNVDNSSSTLEQIKGNPAAPFINSLVNGTARAIINGVPMDISAQVAYAERYHNVLANAQSSVNIHPSEPNYIWSEAGSNLGVKTDDMPYGPHGTNQTTIAHLATLLNRAHVSWRSYQEDVDLVPTSGRVNRPGPGSLTSVVAERRKWTVPLINFKGDSAGYTNEYNGSHHYEYAAKHNPMLFFSNTNGGNNLTITNPMRLHYAPLQQLFTDLEGNAVARYNWITPNLNNDMHTSLDGGFTYGGKHYTGDAANIAQGDNFLSVLIPQIMASRAYRDNGAIIIWMDETEEQNDKDKLTDDFHHTIPAIVISPLAHSNVGGTPYASRVRYSHSSDLKTMQEVFRVSAQEIAAQPFLGDANSPRTNDLSDLFRRGAVPPAAGMRSN